MGKGDMECESSPSLRVRVLTAARGISVCLLLVTWTDQADRSDSADELEVSLPFLLQQAAWLYERQLSQVRAQMRKVGNPNASSAPSPVAGSESASLVAGGHAMRRGGSGGGVAAAAAAAAATISGGQAMRRGPSGGGTTICLAILSKYLTLKYQGREHPRLYRLDQRKV